MKLSLLQLLKYLKPDPGQKWSLHPIYNALWDFNGHDTHMGNPYRLIHPDTLHMLDVGVFSTLVDIIRNMAEANRRTGLQSLRTMDKRLKKIRTNHRYAEFPLPTCSGKHQYFANGGNFAAWEHRAVMQAVASGQNVLAGFRFTMRPIHINDADEVIPPAIFTLLQQQPEIKTHFFVDLNAYLDADTLQVYKTFEVMNCLAITAGHGNRYADWPMYVRATMEFHGRPYFSDIAIQAEVDGEPEETWYGQLRLLFKCQTVSPGGDKSLHQHSRECER
ncbi:unnamed protein product [Calypogeia fissa]